MYQSHPHIVDAPAENVAGSATRDINQRIGFSVDDSNVYGILPKKKSLYIEDDGLMSNNDYESYAESPVRAEMARGRQAEVCVGTTLYGRCC